MADYIAIPQSELGRRLEETRQLKRDMAEALRQLEEQATGRPVARPGSWRQPRS